MPTRLFFLLLKSNRATFQISTRRKIRREIFFFLLHSSNNRHNEFHSKSFHPKPGGGFGREIPTTNSRGNSSGIIQVDKRRVTSTEAMI